MKSISASCIVTIFSFILIIVIIAMALLMPVLGADIIPIATINDSYINNKVTVSGVVINYESGHKHILTIDDRSGTIFVTSDPRLFGDFYGGERITVNGIYVGENMVYADLIYSYVGQQQEYKDITVAGLKEFPEYYYADSVRIKGKVDRIELMREKTELTIDDGTGKINVEYGVELEGIKIDDEVVVEGKFYGNKIYAFVVKAQKFEPVETPGPSPSPTPSPTPSSSVTETPMPTPTPTPPPPPSPTPIEEAGMPTYLMVIIITVVAVAGVFIAFKAREWLMLRRYGK